MSAGPTSKVVCLPPWFQRMGIAMLDLGLAVCVVGGLLRACGIAEVSMGLLASGVGIYYLLTELLLGKTPVKAGLLMDVVRPDGSLPPSKGRFALRAAFRVILGPLCMISWGRVTLLDRLTGLRVHRPPLGKAARLAQKEVILRRSVR